MEMAQIGPTSPNHDSEGRKLFFVLHAYPHPRESADIGAMVKARVGSRSVVYLVDVGP
jgi:hypothetical protein